MLENKINELYKIVKKFEEENNSKTTIIIFDKGEHSQTLAVSSECLDGLRPFDAILKFIKYMKSNDENILRGIGSILPIHTDDENMNKLRESFDEGIKYMNSCELFDNTLTNVYVLI